jgi:hypothetical protein
MKTTALLHAALISGSFISASALTQVTPAHAETLVTCGPNAAAFIVKIVPAGCRHLSATSAPGHSPENPVEESRLGFTFRASAPQLEDQQPVAVNQEGVEHQAVAVLEQP